MKKDLTSFIALILKEMDITAVVPEVVVSENSSHGEYTTNIALRLAKSVGKPPLEIAQDLKKKLEAKIHDHNIHKDNQIDAGQKEETKVLQAIDHVEVVSPGFINIFLSEVKLSSQISEVLKHKEAYGTSKNDKPLRVTLEFTDPNPFKEFHIGHLYSNAVGESLSRLFESQGHTVRRVNYQGDVGMHVAKAIWGLGKTDIAKLALLPLPKRIHALGQAYAKGAQAFEEDKKAAEEMKGLNKKIFAGQGGKIYTMGRKWSLEYFEIIYKRLGTKFAGYYFESKVGERGVKIVQSHLRDGIFEESEGAIVYRGEKKGLHTRVFINQLGLPTYEAKELGLAPTKYEDWQYDRSIIVTGNEINEYFKVLLAALGEVAPELAAKTTHIGHGMVRKADGTKMSSRSGQILTGEGLLDEVKASIYTIIDKNKEKYNKKEQEEIAEKAAVAAIKYSLLRVSLPSDVAFDLKTSVSFDGDSGPYLLYTYARAKSVLGKAKKVSSVKYHPSAGGSSMNPEERAISRLLVYFPDLVADAAAGLVPSMLCSYLFQLASAFNAFYQKHQILESDARLAQTAATAQVLKNGLALLGINTVERM